MIKRLADELSIGGDASIEAGRPSQETAMRASVDALHTTADTMRAAAKKGAPMAASGPDAPSYAATARHTRPSAVAAAVAAGRMDVDAGSYHGARRSSDCITTRWSCVRATKGGRSSRSWRTIRSLRAPGSIR